jgi:hypothetical protein
VAERQGQGIAGRAECILASGRPAAPQVLLEPRGEPLRRARPEFLWRQVEDGQPLFLEGHLRRDPAMPPARRQPRAVRVEGPVIHRLEQAFHAQRARLAAGLVGF